MATHMVLFVIAAVVLNVLIYAGMFGVYMGDKSGTFERRLRRTAPRPSPFAQPPADPEPAPRPLELDLPDRKAA